MHNPSEKNLQLILCVHTLELVGNNGTFGPEMSLQ